MNSPPDTPYSFNEAEGKPKPPVIAHWISNVVCVVVTAAIIGGIWWWTGNGFDILTGQPQRPQRQAEADSPNGTTGEDRIWPRASQGDTGPRQAGRPDAP